MALQGHLAAVRLDDHLVSDALASAPQPVDVVVRALPPAASGPLVEDFTSAWGAALAKVAGGGMRAVVS